MFLILEVTSPNAGVLGAAARMVFTLQGGSIGRRPGNAWVLPDPHVSSQHAHIRAMGGTFFLEDNNSGNGVTVNGNRIHPGEPFPLKDGDVVFIDPFEIGVRLSATRPGVAATEPMSIPAMPARAPVAPPVAPRPGAIGGLDDLIGPGAVPDVNEYNPLLDAPQATPGPLIPSGIDLLGKPVLHDAINIAPPSPRQAPVPPAAPRAPGAGVIPTNWDISQPEPVQEPTPQPFAPPPPLRPRPAAPAAPIAPPLGAPPPHIAAATPPTPTATAARPPAPTDATSADFRALLRGAGIDAESVDPAVAAELGQVLRIVVGGLMEVLRARGEIKAEFRLQQTTFKPRENNPLKYSANVEDALHNLLVKRNAAYLDTPAAFEDAFVDVRNHQLAMLAGMRAAFGYMLSRFDPKALAQQFDARPGRKMSIGLGAGGRHWDSFTEYFKEMTRDEDDCFRRLFGDHFARAYEEQLQRLRAEKRG